MGNEKDPEMGPAQNRKERTCFGGQGGPFQETAGQNMLVYKHSLPTQNGEKHQNMVQKRGGWKFQGPLGNFQAWGFVKIGKSSPKPEYRGKMLLWFYFPCFPGGTYFVSYLVSYFGAEGQKRIFLQAAWIATP